MSDDVPVTEVFEDVEADPDAIIAAYGASDVDDLLAGPGAHDPEPDPAIDGDVDAASDRLSRLADVTLDSSADGASSDGRDGPAATSNRGASSRSSPSGPRYTAETVGGGATVDVLPGDGESLESFLGLDELERTTTSAERDLVLVGPGPTTSRVSNDAFGSPNAAVDSNREPDARSTTWAAGARPDPATVDSEAVTDREYELAESVFEWVS